MKDHFTAFFPDVKVDWNTWFFGTGLPAEFDPTKVLDKTLFSEAEQLANKWKSGGEGAAASDLSWDVSLTMCFIDILINDKTKLSPAALQKMQVQYIPLHCKVAEVPLVPSCQNSVSFAANRLLRYTALLVVLI